jgi:hypothetical protein
MHAFGQRPFHLGIAQRMHSTLSSTLNIIIEIPFHFTKCNPKFKIFFILYTSL